MTPSKGKRDKKRKRKQAKLDGIKEEVAERLETAKLPDLPPLSNHITIGLNSTTRYLEETLKIASIPSKAEVESTKSSKTITVCQKSTEVSPGSVPTTSKAKGPTPKSIAAIFITQRTTHLSYRHLPNLAAKSPSPILRVSLSAASEAKLSHALGIPRVGIVAVFEDTPGATALLTYVRENVEPVDVPWIREAREGKWLKTNIVMESSDGTRVKV